MAAQYGQLSEYHPDTEEIASYLERVEVFIATNEVAEERQAAVFLSVVGARTFALIRDLVSPAKPSAKTFQELCDVLRAHFEPKPIEIAERFYFHSRNQGSTETIAEFLAELRKLATHCQFGESNLMRLCATALSAACVTRQSRRDYSQRLIWIYPRHSAYHRVSRRRMPMYGSYRSRKARVPTFITPTKSRVTAVGALIMQQALADSSKLSATSVEREGT